MTAPAQQPEPLLLSPAEAATRLGISRAYVYELMHTRELHSLKLGKRRLIPDSECQRLIAARLAESAGW
jgi:excisionase family DNA binding protein